MNTDPLTHSIIGAAIEVHRALGPGLLESAYEACLAHELGQRGLSVERQVALPVVYQGLRLECGYRMDMVVEGAVVVEVKAATGFDPVHLAKMLTYLTLSNHTLGLLINFNVRVLTKGVRRVVRGHPEGKELRGRRGR